MNLLPQTQTQLTQTFTAPVTDEPFYMIYCPAGGAPTKQHKDFAEAQAEAERLAARERGKPFYVLQALCCAVAISPVVVTKIRTQPIDVKV